MPNINITISSGDGSSTNGSGRIEDPAVVAAALSVLKAITDASSSTAGPTPAEQPTV